MLEKEKAEKILAEIKQQVQSGNTGNISFSAHTILWMAESLVEAIGEVEKVAAQNQANLKEAETKHALARDELKRLKEDYFKLSQEFRKYETSGIAMESKEKLLKKWRSESS